MALTKAFFEAVDTMDIRGVRIMMKDSLLVDLTFKDFEDMQHNASKMEGLYDEYDGKELIWDKNLWNDDYMNILMVKVLSNFSHERLDHLKEVVKFLRPAEKYAPKKVVSNKAECENKNSYQEEKRRCQENGDYLGAKIGAGAAIGAVAGGVVAVIASTSTIGVVGGIATGAVLGGAFASIIDRKDK